MQSIPRTLGAAITRLQTGNPEEIFGSDSALITQVYQRWALLVHPDHNNNSKKSEQAFKLLTALRAVALEKRDAGTYGDLNAILAPIEIRSPTNTYQITKHIASGDICEVYYGELDLDVWYMKTVIKITRDPRNNDLSLNEATVLKYLREDAPTRDLPVMRHVPSVLDSFELRDGRLRKRVTVQKALEGYYTLEQVIRAYPEGVPVPDAAWMFNRMLAALIAPNQAGIVHGAVLPTHMLVCPATHDGVLVDWSYATRGQPLKAISGKYRTFYPDEVFEKRNLNSSTDIYMAALVFLDLIGGVVSMQKIPDDVPRAIKGLIKACLLSQSKRPQNTWEFHQEFGDVLKTVYGPRTFRPFHMPPVAASTATQKP